MNSMVAGGAYCLGLLILGPLAEHMSVATAIVVAGALSILGALLTVRLSVRSGSSRRKSSR